jgi:uncharacterized membrane protein (DUF2068 family)
LGESASALGKNDVVAQWCALRVGRIFGSFALSGQHGRRKNSSMKTSQTRAVRLIAFFKLLKAVLLIAVGVAALKLLHTDIANLVEGWASTLGVDQNSRFVGRALSAAAALTPNRVRDLIVGSFLYGGLFLTEGIGLWLLKRWAMWFTVIITGSFLPVEIYELARHPSAGKVGVLVINLVMVGYLIRRIRDGRSG